MCQPVIPSCDKVSWSALSICTISAFLRTFQLKCVVVVVETDLSSPTSVYRQVFFTTRQHKFYARGFHNPLALCNHCSYVCLSVCLRGGLQKKPLQRNFSGFFGAVSSIVLHFLRIASDLVNPSTCQRSRSVLPGQLVWQMMRHANLSWFCAAVSFEDPLVHGGGGESSRRCCLTLPLRFRIWPKFAGFLVSQILGLVFACLETRQRSDSCQILKTSGWGGLGSLAAGTA